MKKLSKVLYVIMLIVMMASVTIPVLATTGEGILGTLDPKMNDASKVQSIGNQVLGIIQVVGTVAGVAILMLLGIKYMMGSAEEKAEYKKTMIPYVVGLVLLIAAVNIVKVVVSVANGITTA